MGYVPSESQRLNFRLDDDDDIGMAAGKYARMDDDGNMDTKVFSDWKRGIYLSLRNASLVKITLK